MSKRALVIGANGGIAQAIILKLLNEKQYDTVYGVSRTAAPLEHDRYHHFSCAQGRGEDISDSIAGIAADSLDLAICCIGTLQNTRLNIEPEKKIEDLNLQQLTHYFATNTILPALWLQAVESKMCKSKCSHLVFLSARVGSTSDNRLGGWYGYRASKAALNSLIKSAQIEYWRRKPQCTLVLYHPGTVDTSLSKPFQKNVPKHKLFSAEFSASKLLEHLSVLQSTDAPHYIDWQGKSIPW